jgi:hypothetical protein
MSREECKQSLDAPAANCNSSALGLDSKQGHDASSNTTIEGEMPMQLMFGPTWYVSDVNLLHVR